MITAPELAAAVKEMRASQTEYFKSKDWKVLEKCKSQERKIDKMVSAVLNAQVPQTGKLF
jgi:hypothetical protein